MPCESVSEGETTKHNSPGDGSVSRAADTTEYECEASLSLPCDGACGQHAPPVSQPAGQRCGARARLTYAAAVARERERASAEVSSPDLRGKGKNPEIAVPLHPKTSPNRVDVVHGHQTGVWSAFSYIYPSKTLLFSYNVWVKKLDTHRA